MSRFPEISTEPARELINWGDPGDYRNRKPKAAASTKADKPKPPIGGIKQTAIAVSKPTAAELLAKAKSDARAKLATVKASSAYKGREAIARNLLLNSSHSAAEIVKTLAKSATDAQLNAVDKHLAAKATDAVWSKAYRVPEAPNAADKAPQSKTGASQYQELWARAYSRPKMARSDLP
jgi:hypothetical protein